ncbi:MAG TPA: DNA-formamidopyrimidine glycosylase family protein [Fimbriimonadaceae bacterium]|nr:DNA-formamidopyrimidine glycosylase family protein [Fimbriimonadaceae bacterium]
MPELPDVTIYVEALRARVVERRLVEARLYSPFVLRTFEPQLRSLEGLEVERVERLGKRIVIGFQGDLYLVIHLMIAGRLLWKEEAAPNRQGGKIALACFVFESGALTLTEAGSKRRAGVHVLRGTDALAHHDPGGLDVFTADSVAFREALQAENRTLKRALSNPRRFDGIGNAYSDEILHEARLSPLRLSRSLSEDEVVRLHEACRHVLATWVKRLRTEFGARFPGSGQITAFRPDFAVHGKFGLPCPRCGVKVQRIRYAENETNYCPRCQNEDRILADRSLSRLLKDDWPRTVEEMGGG